MPMNRATFVQIAREVVPDLRRAIDDLETSDVAVVPSACLTATIEIDGRKERVRVTVELNPNEETDNID